MAKDLPRHGWRGGAVLATRPMDRASLLADGWRVGFFRRKIRQVPCSEGRASNASGVRREAVACGRSHRRPPSPRPRPPENPPIAGTPSPPRAPRRPTAAAASTAGGLAVPKRRFLWRGGSSASKLSGKGLAENGAAEVRFVCLHSQILGTHDSEGGESLVETFSDLLLLIERRQVESIGK